jgi:hypothetical protein
MSNGKEQMAKMEQGRRVRQQQKADGWLGSQDEARVFREINK